MIDRQTRRYLVILLCVLVLWAVIAWAWGGQAGAQGVIVGKHLFIDDALIDRAQSSGWALRVNPPTVLKRVVGADKPWENFGFYHFQITVRDVSTANFEAARFAMSYPAWYVSEDGKTSVVYDAIAVSDDGLNWRKPGDINGFKFNGQPSNIMNVHGGDVAGAIYYSGIDPQAPKAERYKRFGFAEGRMAITEYSADGIRWKAYNPPVYLTEQPYKADGTHDFIYLPKTNQYLWLIRGWGEAGKPANRSTQLSRSASVDKLQWTDIPNPLLQWPNATPPQYAVTGEIPLLDQTDAAEWALWDAPRQRSVQLYRQLPFVYPWAEDVYLSMTWVFYLLSTTTERRGTGNDGDFESQLAVSRNGVDWKRYRVADGQPPYLSRGAIDGLLMYQVLPGNDILRVGDKLYVYFLALPKSKQSAWIDGVWASYRTPAARDAQWRTMDQGGVYVAEQRLDGFVALRASGTQSAIVTTQAMVPAGGTLTVNYSGPVFVEVLDESGTIISKSLAGDGLRTVVANNLPSKPLRVRFTIAPAGRVYAFEFGAGTAATVTPLPTATGTPVASTATPTARPTATPTTRPSATLSPTATPTSTPTKAIPVATVNMLDNAVFRFESAAIAIPDGYRIDVVQVDTSACWHYDVPGTLAGQRVTFSSELFRSADMGAYAPYLSLQVLRAQAWAYNVGGVSRHTAAPGTWQAVSQTTIIPTDARQVRASFCVWRAGPGTARARDLQMVIP